LKTSRRTLLIWLAVLAVGVFAAFRFVDRGTDRTQLSLDAYQRKLANGKVDSATLYDSDHVVKGELTDGTAYEVRYPSDYASALTKKIVNADVEPFEVDNQGESLWMTLAINVLPFVLVFGVVLFFLNQVQGGGNRLMSFGRARTKQVTKDSPKTTFADVAGLDEAVEELQEIKEFLESPEKFQQMGAKIPKGVLLFGPPGTGKTLLAKAVAGDAGVPFFSIGGSDFVEMFVGVGASRVRDLFDQAKKTAPAIIYVDEIDAVGRQRGAGVGGGHDEREQTLNQLLVEMDGFDARTGVILLASTNRPDILDPALLRPGRFDRQIVVDRPALEGRRQILEVHARDKPIAPGVDLGVIARRTPGFTGADLANLVNEAALLCARRGLTQIGLPQLEEASERVMAGPERKSRIISERERRVIAYHEGGHALVAHALPNADPVHKISIIPRGRALGYTIQRPTEDRFLMTRGELENRMAVLLGGRAAEAIVFGEVSTGAADDLTKATEIARNMVTRFGMSEKLGQAAYDSRRPTFLGDQTRQALMEREFSEETAREIDVAVRDLVDGAYDRAVAILTTYRRQLDAGAALLLEKETLTRDEIPALEPPLVERRATA